MRRRTVLLLTGLVVLAGAVAPAPARAANPIVTYELAGTPGDNGWFRGPVTVLWRVDFNGRPAIGTRGCEPAVTLTADTPGRTLTCTAQNVDGTTEATTRTIQIDKTPPTGAGVTPDRPPDRGGWYRAPVGLRWSGVDALSGIASCTSLTYAGPEGSATPTGTCRDGAGNTSAPVPYGLSYDATAPTLREVTATGGDTVATVRWRASPDATVTVARSPEGAGARATAVYSTAPGGSGRFEDTGLRNGVRYDYKVTATDAAGNTTSARAAARTVTWLRGPRPDARVARPPLLRWQRVRGARYYNVQLFRGDRKVMSAWPTRAALRLHRSWRYGGRRQRLSPGVYTWFVWPGYGKRSERRYGRLLGTRRFAVVRRAAR
ncbi:MAG TPA: hypothetical protein VHF51_07100 [Solirubrobacteraceae bacterium]|nr:hypothetical protein [Solirubrobacteraceae bacterium]